MSPEGILIHRWACHAPTGKAFARALLELRGRRPCAESGKDLWTEPGDSLHRRQQEVSRPCHEKASEKANAGLAQQNGPVPQHMRSAMAAVHCMDSAMWNSAAIMVSVWRLHCRRRARRRSRALTRRCGLTRWRRSSLSWLPRFRLRLVGHHCHLRRVQPPHMRDRGTSRGARLGTVHIVGTP